MLPNLTLAYQIAELKPTVEGSILRNVQELPNKWLKLRLQTKQGTKDLIATPNELFLTAYSMPAKQTTSGYGAFLRKHLRSKKLVSLQQHGLDRIAVIEFPESFLVLELFAKGNIVLVDRKMNILSAYRKESWKDRQLRKGVAYKFPSPKGVSPASLTPAGLKKLFSKSKTDAVRALIAAVNIAPVFAEAACSKAGVGKAKRASELGAGDVGKICSAVREIYSVDLEKEQPVLVEKGGEKMLLPLNFSLPTAKVLQGFDSVNAALDFLCSRQFSAAARPEQRAAEERKAKLLRSLGRQRKAIAELQRAIELNKAKAEAIYANYSRIFQFIEAAKGERSAKQGKSTVMYKLKKRFPFLQKLDSKTGKAVLLLQGEEN